MSKLHMTYVTKGQDKPSGAAYCGNNNRGYKFGLRVAMAKEFRAAPLADRCAHCEQIYLDLRNKQRKAKGLAPVATPFEGLDNVGS